MHTVKPIRYINSIERVFVHSVHNKSLTEVYNISVSDLKSTWKELWTPSFLIELYLGKHKDKNFFYKFTVQSHLDISSSILRDRILVTQCMKYLSRRVKSKNSTDPRHKLIEVTTYKIAFVHNGTLSSNVMTLPLFKKWHHMQKLPVVFIDTNISKIFEKV